MLHLIRDFVRDENGEDLIEYGLLSSFAAAIVLAVLITDPVGLKTAIVAAFNKAVEALHMAGDPDLVRV